MGRALLTVLLLSASAFGQGSRYDGVASGPRGSIADAMIAVCVLPASTQTSPCAPLATLYTDSTLRTACNGSNGCSNPLKADRFGNFHFYGRNGLTYTVQIYGVQLNTSYSLIDQIVPIDPSNATFKQLNSIRFADQFPGLDIGAQINAAYADCPATGCTIMLPASLSCHSYSTPIVFGTSSKAVVLKGASRHATCLSYTSDAGNAVTFDTGFNHEAPSRIEDLELLGPGKATATIGLMVGTMNGAEGLTLSNVEIHSFGTGQKFGTNLSWGFNCDHSWYFDNGQEILLDSKTSGMESTRFSHCVFGDSSGYVANGFQITGNPVNVQLTDSEFDGVGLQMANGTVDCMGCHFENVAYNSRSPFILITGGGLSLSATQLVQTQTAGYVPAALINVRGDAKLSMYGGAIYSNAALANAIYLEGSGNVSVWGITIDSDNFTNRIGLGAEYTGRVSTDWNVLGAPQSATISSGTPVFRLSRGASNADLRQNDNWTANTFEIAGTGVSLQVDLSGQGVRVPALFAKALLASAVAPTISSGFGISPSISTNNGTAAFTVNVGRGGTASAGVIHLPTAANGWNCFANDLTSPAANFTKQTASSTTSATLTNYNSSGSATPWASGGILSVSCFAR